ncbi:hypothetical protein OCU04_006617 [Sclerotinia nivalis]|uniref:C2H2-type domain-containing protein n=1 Tax=Sclerotinia nivalis TaxID=352851 RepID=A0A9X0AK45_9HELO|nr:hypothetical protein OCU04_006617 [Sclerotinia nivalis]
MENDAQDPGVGLHPTWNSMDHSWGHYEPPRDEQAYDFGAAADSNADLLRRKNNEIDALNILRSSTIPTTPLWSTSYATTSIPEAAVYIPVDINTGFDSCETKRHPFLQCDLEMSTANLTENGDANNRTGESSAPTTLVNHEHESGHPFTALSPPYGFSKTLPSDGSKETSAKVIRDRVSCTHPGCRKTFSRPDDLRRHFKNIHTQDFRVTCPVYGCHRTTKPFKREDKFMEHFRKHDNSRSYRCLMETCQSAPFDIHGLINHLVRQHYMDHNTQQNLDWISKNALKISIPFWFGRLCSTGGELCPLAPIGCTYRPAADVGENLHASTMRAHIITHELSDRMTGKQLLQDFFADDSTWSLDEGERKCMLCSFWATGGHHREIFVAHLMTDHSEQDRSSVLKDIFRLVDDFRCFCAFHHVMEGPNSRALANECRAAGFVFWGI